MATIRESINLNKMSFLREEVNAFEDYEEGLNPTVVGVFSDFVFGGRETTMEEEFHSIFSFFFSDVYLVKLNQWC